MHIRLIDLTFHAYIGVFKQEQAVGADYKVNLDVELPMPESIGNDCLEDTISYADFFQIVKVEMSQPCALLENTAFRIIKKIREKYMQVKHASVCITKIAPPIAALQGSAEVEISF